MPCSVLWPHRSADVANYIVIGMQEIFDNILNRRLEWPEGGMSAECRDLIDQLLQTDPDMRLGHSGVARPKRAPLVCGPGLGQPGQGKGSLCARSWTARATPATSTPRR